MKGYFQIVIGLFLIVLALLAAVSWPTLGRALLLLIEGGILAAVGLIGLALILLGVSEARSEH